MTIPYKFRSAVQLLAGIGLCVSFVAHADEGMSWKFSGFGTVGAVVTDTDEAEYRANVRQQRGATKSADLGVDTRLGLQVNAKFNDMFSGVGQVLTSRRDGKVEPQLEWLFGQAAVAPWLNLRAGRMVLPVFLMSDTRSVGYAQHWVRAPQEAYLVYSPTSFDGAMADIHSSIADINLGMQVSVGRSDGSKLYLGGTEIDLTYKRLTSISLSAERGDWLVRYGRTSGPDVKLKGLPFPGGLPETDDVFSGVGVQYDNGKLLVLSEYLTRRNNNNNFDTDSYYLTTGYRFGTFMPYVIASRLKGKGLLTVGNQSTQAIGLRWDAVKNTAIKAQFESTKSTNQFVNATPAFLANPRAKVLSVAVDFVF